jgi:hypothetical protein
MFQPIKRAMARRHAVRMEATVLVNFLGCEAIEIALDKSFETGISHIERRFWRDVAIRAERWQQYLASLDTATRYQEADRYLR